MKEKKQKKKKKGKKSKGKKSQQAQESNILDMQSLSLNTEDNGSRNVTIDSPIGGGSSSSSCFFACFSLGGASKSKKK